VNAELVGIVAVAFLSLAGAVFSAVMARRTNNASVDVRILKLLQEDVVAMRERVDQMRRELWVAQDETDEERRRRRRIEAQVDAMADLVDRMRRAMLAANVPLPSDAEALLNFPSPSPPAVP